MTDDPVVDLTASARHRVRLVQVLAGHQVMILAYARAIVRDLHLAEDVYQEVAVILAQDPTRMPEDDGFAPWLREINPAQGRWSCCLRRAAPVRSTTMSLSWWPVRSSDPATCARQSAQGDGQLP